MDTSFRINAAFAVTESNAVGVNVAFQPTGVDETHAVFEHFLENRFNQVALGQLLMQLHKRLEVRDDAANYSLKGALEGEERSDGQKLRCQRVDGAQGFTFLYQRACKVEQPAVLPVCSVMLIMLE